MFARQMLVKDARATFQEGVCEVSFCSCVVHIFFDSVQYFWTQLNKVFVGSLHSLSHTHMCTHFVCVVQYAFCLFLSPDSIQMQAALLVFMSNQCSCTSASPPAPDFGSGYRSKCWLLAPRTRGRNCAGGCRRATLRLDKCVCVFVHTYVFPSVTHFPRAAHVIGKTLRERPKALYLSPSAKCIAFLCVIACVRVCVCICYHRFIHKDRVPCALLGNISQAIYRTTFICVCVCAHLSWVARCTRDCASINPISFQFENPCAISRAPVVGFLCSLSSNSRAGVCREEFPRVAIDMRNTSPHPPDSRTLASKAFNWFNSDARGATSRMFIMLSVGDGVKRDAYTHIDKKKPHWRTHTRMPSYYASIRRKRRNDWTHEFRNVRFARAIITFS